MLTQTAKFEKLPDHTNTVGLQHVLTKASESEHICLPSLNTDANQTVCWRSTCPTCDSLLLMCTLVPVLAAKPLPLSEAVAVLVVRSNT